MEISIPLFITIAVIAVFCSLFLWKQFKTSTVTSYTYEWLLATVCWALAFIIYTVAIPIKAGGMLATSLIVTGIFLALAGYKSYQTKSLKFPTEIYALILFLSTYYVLLGTDDRLVTVLFYSIITLYLSIACLWQNIALKVKGHHLALFGIMVWTIHATYITIRAIFWIYDTQYFMILDFISIETLSYVEGGIIIILNTLHFWLLSKNKAAI